MWLSPARAAAHGRKDKPRHAGGSGSGSGRAGHIQQRGPGSILLVAMVVLVIWMVSYTTMYADTTPRMATLPFSPGERLHYALRWTAVPAGEAILEVLPMKTIDGEPVYHFRLTIKSNAFVDIFYRVRDRIDSYVDATVSRSLWYHKNQEEGSARRNITVSFDSKAGKAWHDNGEKITSIDLPQGVFDPLSAFYYVRTMAFGEKDTIERYVSDGKKCVIGIARIIKRERITIGEISYDTFLVEPAMEEIGGVFEKEKGAKIKLWVTADERHIPVKIASKVAIGSFVGELVSARTPALAVSEK